MPYHIIQGYTGSSEAVWQNNMQSMSVDLGNGFEWSRFKLRISLYICLWYPASTEQLIDSGNHLFHIRGLPLVAKWTTQLLGPYIYLFSNLKHLAAIECAPATPCLPSMYVSAMYMNVRNRNTLKPTYKFSLFRRPINNVFTPTSHSHFLISSYILECEAKTMSICLSHLKSV